MCCSLWGHKESDTTEQLNNNNIKDFPFLPVVDNLDVAETGILYSNFPYHSTRKLLEIINEFSKDAK